MGFVAQFEIDGTDLFRLRDALASYRKEVQSWGGMTQRIQWWIDEFEGRVNAAQDVLGRTNEAPELFRFTVVQEA